MPTRLRKAMRTITPDSRYVWRRETLWDGEATKVGSPIPESLRNDRVKLGVMLSARKVMRDGGHAHGKRLAKKLLDAPVPEVTTPVTSVAETPVASNIFGDTLAAMGWKRSDAVEADAQKTGVVDWKKLNYFGQMKLARSLGYDGANMSKVDLTTYLETNYHGEPA